MIEIDNLSFNYPKVAPLFSKLNLNLMPGKICGLLGKNGAGKTTLLKIISGLLFPQEGKCAVLGFEPSARCAQYLAKIYFVPEEFYLPSISTKEYENLYAPFYPKFDHSYFKTCLEEFELTQANELSALSYGQRKKFLLAFAFATNCELLLLDEPTNGLDIPSKSQLRKLLVTAVSDANSDSKTIMISTHQVREVENLIDSVVILNEGKIIFNNDISTVSRHFIVTTQSTPPETQESLYSEKTLNGHRVLAANKLDAEYESEIDIEMLFNAVLLNHERINAICVEDKKMGMGKENKHE